MIKIAMGALLSFWLAACDGPNNNNKTGTKRDQAGSPVHERSYIKLNNEE